MNRLTLPLPPRGARSLASLALCSLVLSACVQTEQSSTAHSERSAAGAAPVGDGVDAALRRLGIEHLSFNLDYRAMEMRLRSAPGREFFDMLESKGWRRSSNAGRADIYFKDGMWLMYIPSRQSILYSPPED